MPKLEHLVQKCVGFMRTIIMSDEDAKMLEMLTKEFNEPQHVPVGIIALRCAGTIFLCGVIGLERELRTDTAGLRTNILVGLAAVSFALITLNLIGDNLGDPNVIRADPVRLVEAVTGGVAFLAAGIIVFSKGEVRGLTTGASMWLAASIGLATGLGYWILAGLATVGGFVVLSIFRRMEIAAGMKDD